MKGTEVRRGVPQWGYDADTHVRSDVSEALLRVLRTLSVSRLFKVCSGVSEALAFVFCIVLCFIALPDCALRLDGKAWPHPQTARLT